MRVYVRLQIIGYAFWKGNIDLYINVKMNVSGIRRFKIRPPYVSIRESPVPVYADVTKNTENLGAKVRKVTLVVNCTREGIPSF